MAMTATPAASRQSPAGQQPTPAKLSDPQALELALEQSKQKQAELERDRREAELLGGIVFRHDGMEASNLASLWRLATMYSRSDMVPEQFRGKPENCLIAMQMAQRCRIDAFAFMQSSYVVHGRPGIESKLAIAMLNSSGSITGRVRYEFTGTGKTRCCTACVKDAASGEEIKLSLDWATVEAEKWHSKPGSKWLTITDQMFRYRAAIFLIRAHYPEVVMGLRTTEEIDDEVTAPPVPVGPPVGANIRLNGAKASRVEPPDPPPAEPVPDPENRKPEPTPGRDVPEANGEDEMARRDMIDDFMEKIGDARSDKELSAVSAELARHHQFLGTETCDMLIEKMRVRTQEIAKK